MIIYKKCLGTQPAFSWEKFHNRIDFATVCPTGDRFNGKAYKAAFFNGYYSWLMPNHEWHSDDAVKKHRTVFIGESGKVLAEYARVTGNVWRFKRRTYESVINTQALRVEWRSHNRRRLIKARLQSLFHLNEAQWKAFKSDFLE